MDANNIFGNNNITLTNPVKVFNFESRDNQISSIIAAYLAVHLNNIDSLKEILLPKTKMNDVTDHSLLFFDKRHAYEVCCILDGILDYFQEHSYILATNRRNLIKQIFNKLLDTLKNLDKKILKILNYGLKFCFGIIILSAVILFTYLFFVHSNFVFQIGLLTFQLGICFIAEFFASAITVDAISKQSL